MSDFLIGFIWGIAAAYLFALLAFFLLMRLSIEDEPQ